MQRNPHSAEALFGRGDAFMQDGQYDRAMTDLMAAIRLAPKMATAYSLRGDILLISGDNRAAIADYRKALELDPSRAQFHCDLGVALVRDEQFAEAAECLKRAARLNPQMTRALIYLAVAYFSEGNEEESNRTLARAVEIDPKLKGAKLKRYETKHLAIVNNTERTLELKIWYYTNAVGGEWRWYPEAPDEGPPAVHVLEPRATFSPAVKGVKLPVGKIRFTARDKSGGPRPIRATSTPATRRSRTCFRRSRAEADGSGCARPAGSEFGGAGPRKPRKSRAKKAGRKFR